MELNQIVVSTQESIIDSAKNYVDYGLPIIPICSADHSEMSGKHRSKCKSPGKTPLLYGWQTKNFTDHDELENWTKKFKHFNLGLPLGDTSGYVAIDIDGEEGVKILKDISKGELPETWEFTTGNGHRLIYKLPPGVITKKHTIKGDGKHQECAFLVTGQQTVLPPSVHYSGTLYEWVEGKSPTDIICGESPDWLNRLVVSDDMSDFEREMQYTPFDSTGPEEMATLTLTKQEVKDKAMESRRQNSKKGRKVTSDDWTIDIEEGGRDNHLTMLIGSIISKGLPREMIENMIHNYNDKHCKPPLERQKVDLIINNLYQLDSAKRNEMGIEELPKKFIPTRYLPSFEKECKKLGVEFKYDNVSGRFYCYDNRIGYWKPVSSSAIELTKIVRSVITDTKYGANPFWDSMHNINEFIMVMKEYYGLMSRDETSIFDMGETYAMHQEYINFKNGMLNWETGELVPHNPDFYSTVQFDLEYVAETKCPTWEKALEEWLPEEHTRRVVQEYVGLSLIPDMSFRKALYLYGSGANGKSMFIDAISRLFSGTCTNLPLAKLKEKFSVRYLQNKLINICGELDNARIKETAMIKSAIAGDALRGEIKGGAEYTFRPVARMIFASNHYPVANETSYGWTSRIMIIPFTQQFPINPRYKRNFETMVFGTELPGLLNWAIEGLKRVQDNSDFTHSEEVTKQSTEYMKVNDHLYAFVNEMIIEEHDYRSLKDIAIPTTYLYDLYMEWTEYQGIKRPLSKRWFNQRVESFNYEKKRSTHNFEAQIGGTKQTQCWIGMKLNSAAEFFKENQGLETALKKALAPKVL